MITDGRTFTNRTLANRTFSNPDTFQPDIFQRRHFPTGHFPIQTLASMDTFQPNTRQTQFCNGLNLCFTKKNADIILVRSV